MTTSANSAGAPKAEATLALLWERIRRQGDMPGFSRAINAILASMRGEDEREFSMTQTVLSDPVLTQKVLRLANSGMYSAFGQRITTVSKAVLVLGPEAIGHLALGLKLIEEMSKSTPDSAHAHVEMEKAVLAGMVAQQIASGATRDPEQAVVCSILHALGRMMVTFYMPERWTRMQVLAGPGIEDEAAHDVLGMSLDAIGRATAEHWGLPRNLLASMHKVEPGVPTTASGAAAELSETDWLAALGTMSTRCANSLWNDDEAGAAQVMALASAYGPLLGVAPEQVMAAIDQARIEAVAELTIAPLAKPAARRAMAEVVARKREAGNRVLMSGAADMRDASISATPGQMMSMALESLYQGLSFSRAFAFLRNRRDGKYLARIGFGAGARALIPNLSFDDAYAADVFHAALSSDRVIFIENAREPKFVAKLPAWWCGTLSEARSFVIIPLCLNGQPVGFMYGDWDDTFPTVSLSQTEFGLINDVRGLVVRTVEKRAQNDASAPAKA